jgi:hypothetical protein
MTKKQEVLATMIGGALGGLVVALTKPVRPVVVVKRYEVTTETEEPNMTKVTALQTERALLELRLAGLTEDTFSDRFDRMQLQRRINDLDRQIRRELY